MTSKTIQRSLIVATIFTMACGGGDKAGTRSHWTTDKTKVVTGEVDSIAYAIELPTAMEADSSGGYAYKKDGRTYAPMLRVGVRAQYKGLAAWTADNKSAKITDKTETPNEFSVAYANDEKGKDFIIVRWLKVGDKALTCWARIYRTTRDDDVKANIPRAFTMCGSLKAT